MVRSFPWACLRQPSPGRSYCYQQLANIRVHYAETECTLSKMAVVQHALRLLQFPGSHGVPDEFVVTSKSWVVLPLNFRQVCKALSQIMKESLSHLSDRCPSYTLSFQAVYNLAVQAFGTATAPPPVTPPTVPRADCVNSPSTSVDTVDDGHWVSRAPLQDGAHSRLHSLSVPCQPVPLAAGRWPLRLISLPFRPLSPSRRPAEAHLLSSLAAPPAHRRNGRAAWRVCPKHQRRAGGDPCSLRGVGCARCAFSDARLLARARCSVAV